MGEDDNNQPILIGQEDSREERIELGMFDLVYNG